MTNSNSTLIEPTASELLDELEQYSDSQPENKQRRVAIWEKLAIQAGKSGASDLVRDLAHDLGVQPITVRRWINGEYLPRTALLPRIRSHFGIGVSDSATPHEVSL